MTSHSPSISMRPGAPEDYDFLMGLYRSVRADELALTGWDEAQLAAFVRMQFDARELHYRTHYPTGINQIILVDGSPVGQVYWANLAGELHFLDITIAPEFRNRGIGTSIITGFLDQAAGEGKPARIWVESFNPSMRLFERLGFKPAEENGCLLLMEWRSDKLA